MTAPRRVPTEVERAAAAVEAGHAWREVHPGGFVPGEPVQVHLHPDECVLVIREGVGVMCVRDHHRHDETPGMALPPAPDIHYGPPIRPPHLGPPPLITRRRWWHRLTRRAL